MPKNADAATIKKAYRRKSKECHPDRKGGDTTAMVWVNKAYETLTDPEKRSYYDACGADKPLSSLEQNARNILVQVAIQAALSNERGTNLLTVIGQELSKMLEECNKQKAQIAEASKRLEAHCPNIECEEENDIVHAFRTQIAASEEVIQRTNAREEAINKAQEMLKKYKNLAKKQAPLRYGSVLMYTMGGTGA